MSPTNRTVLLGAPFALLLVGGGWIAGRQAGLAAKRDSGPMQSSETSRVVDPQSFQEHVRSTKDDSTHAVKEHASIPPPPIASSVAAANAVDTTGEDDDHEVMHEQAIARHWREPVDAHWSKRAEKDIVKGLDEISAKNGFSVVRTDCRTESCVAVTEWSNYTQAVNGWGDIIHHSYGLPCGVEVLLEAPVRAEARYQTTVLFRCDPNDRAAPTL